MCCCWVGRKVGAGDFAGENLQRKEGGKGCVSCWIPEDSPELAGDSPSAL